MASIVDAIDDVNKDVIQCHFEADETKKAEIKRRYTISLISVEKLPNIAQWMKDRPDTKF